MIITPTNKDGVETGVAAAGDVARTGSGPGPAAGAAARNAHGDRRGHKTHGRSS